MISKLQLKVKYILECLPLLIRLYPHVLTLLDLELGELAHDDLFGLFEAMSAIEMMDPKMDAGMHQITNGTKKILSFDQAVKAEKLELKKVNPEQFIGT